MLLEQSDNNVKSIISPPISNPEHCEDRYILRLLRIVEK